MRRSLRKQEGGFVLLVVLALLVLLTVVASIAYSRASDQVVMSTALKRQAIAQDRALMGMHRAVAEVGTTPRPASLTGLSTAMICNNTDATTCPDAVPPVMVDNGITKDLDQGGGSQYQIRYHRWQPVGASAPVIVVHATGYHGFDPAVRPGSTRLTSEVIVEVSEGSPNTGGCVGYCGSGL